MNHTREELAAAHRPQRLTILTKHFVTPLRPFLVHRMVACNKRLRYLLSWLNLRNTSISIFSCAVYDVLMSVSGCVRDAVLVLWLLNNIYVPMYFMYCAL